MCGIAGAHRSAWDVGAAVARIRHRGPDGSGTAQEGATVHGHVRLALLDLTDASAQPFRYRDGLLTFNGEVWNYRELRDELRALGHEFRTTGDTEVLAAALWQWGAAALQRLDGMFAFAWTSGALSMLARDQFGKVPLYVKRSGAAFEWASERKAWGFGHGAAAAPLPPASWLDLNTARVSVYYRLPERADGDVLALLDRGVRKRLVADAPLCVLISGGLDSAAVLTLATRAKRDVVAYTAKLDDNATDLRAARQLCREMSVPLREVPVAPPTAEAIERAAQCIEIPSKAQTEIAALCIPLAERIARDGFKACLSGEASDELFGGYGNMAIAASQPGASWRKIRTDQLAKMARGNFVRCNKAFMAAGVECRLPFMETQLVEHVIGLDKRECPPGKGALKSALRGVVPEWVIRRPKETFQGSSGMADACARVIASPQMFYNATIRRAFGGTVEA